MKERPLVGDILYCTCGECEDNPVLYEVTRVVDGFMSVYNFRSGDQCGPWPIITEYVTHLPLPQIRIIDDE